MPKPITGDMIEAMGRSERKSLHENALRCDTPAAKAILELIAQSELNLVAKAKGTGSNGLGSKSRSKAKKE